MLSAHAMNDSYAPLADCSTCRNPGKPLQDGFCNTPSAYQHLNAGFLMGPAAHVHEVVSLWLARFSRAVDDDQLVARCVQFERPELVTLDYTGGLILNIGEFTGTSLGKLLDVQDGVVYNHATQQVQCFLHGNGLGKGSILRLLDYLTTF